jgi:hypothetical protein
VFDPLIAPFGVSCVGSMFWLYQTPARDMGEAPYFTRRIGVFDASG